MKIAVGGFAGSVMAPNPKELADTVGVTSLNQKPGRGDLRPWRQALRVASVPLARASIYRFGRDVRSDSQYWMSWPTRTHVVRGYNAEDTTERTYYTGDGAPKWVDNTFAIAGAGPYPTATRNLGVPAPVSAAVFTSNNDGTSTSVETVYATYTYVTSKGDEGAPAPVSAQLNCRIDDTRTIDSLAAAPGGYDITLIRVYVTVSGQSGDTEFFFLREIPYTDTSATDDLRSRGEVLPTDGWLPPPADLSCLTPMWNGMLAGISGKGVRVCAAFAPYAWPIANEFLPADASPVGLGVWQQNLLMLTTGTPQLLTGTTPDSLDMAPLDGGQACIAEPAIVSFPHGVAWPSQDGLCYYGQLGSKLLTQGIFTRDDWLGLNPAGMLAGVYEGAYLCFYTDADNVRRGFLIDPMNPTGAYFLDKGYDALFFDKLQDALYVYDAATGNVSKWDAGAALMTATWRSKVFVTPPVNLTRAKVVADAFPVTLKVDAGPFTLDEQAALIAARPALTAVGTDTVRFTATINDRDAITLPDGFTATDWQVQIETSASGGTVGAELADNVQEIA